MTLAVLLAGLAGALVGLLVAGTSAFWSVLVGTVVVAAVFAGGAAAVNTVAGLMPAAALMVAMLTYFLQVLLVLVTMGALADSGALDDPLDRGWVSGAVIGATLIWMAGQVAVTTRARIPVYDLPERRPDQRRAAR